MGKQNKKQTIHSFAALAAFTPQSSNNGPLLELNAERLAQVELWGAQFALGEFENLPQLLKEPEKYGRSAINLVEIALVKCVGQNNMPVLQQILSHKFITQTLKEKNAQGVVQAWIKAIHKNHLNACEALYECADFKETFKKNSKKFVYVALDKLKKNQYRDLQVLPIMEFLFNQTEAIETNAADNVYNELMDFIEASQNKHHFWPGYAEKLKSFTDTLFVSIERDTLRQEVASVLPTSTGSAKKVKMKI